MSRQQRLILVFLAAANLLLFLVFGLAVFYTSRLERQASIQPPTATPTVPPVLPPTWTPVPTPTPYVPPTPAPRSLTNEETGLLQKTAEQVVQLRGLEFRNSAPCWVLSKRQLLARTRARAPEPETTEGSAYALMALGWIQRRTELDRIVQCVMTEIAGYYETREKAVYLISDGEISGAMAKLVLAHELTHALQDQHFDLERLLLGGDEVTITSFPLDQEQASRALIEGDASLLTAQYLQSLPREEIWTYVQEVWQLPSSCLENISPHLREMWYFPYTYGTQFVNFLYERGGWAEVNAAYGSPPVSTEQILHPERYLAGDVPRTVPSVDLSGVLKESWKPVFGGTVGEFALRLFLGEWLVEPLVLSATRGWGGDALTVYVDERGQTLLILHTVWDTPEDAGEFREALESSASARYGSPPVEVGEAELCWAGSEEYCLSWRDDAVVMVKGPERSLVLSVVRAILQR